MKTLIEVWWREESCTWRVDCRPDPAAVWSSFDGDEDELSRLLGLAHDVVTGG